MGRATVLDVTCRVIRGRDERDLLGEAAGTDRAHVGPPRTRRPTGTRIRAVACLLSACPRAQGCERVTGVGQQILPRCACCGYRTGCTTCPICYWTDDGHNDLPSSTAGSNLNTDLSLADARLNFSIYGASAPRYQNLVRPPRPDERP